MSVVFSSADASAFYSFGGCGEGTIVGSTDPSSFIFLDRIGLGAESSLQRRIAVRALMTSYSLTLPSGVDMAFFTASNCYVFFYSASSDVAAEESVDPRSAAAARGSVS